MTATADMILERRKARRTLAFWRIAAIVAVVIALIAILPRFAGGPGDHVARIPVTGIIFHDTDREAAILNLVDNDDVKAVIIEIDSPGGTLVGSEALYDAIRKVAEVKPVAAVMTEVAASGGYVTAIAADRIFARRNTLTGSIGVVMEAPNIEGLLEMVGVEVTRIKSAPLKAEPSFTSSPTAETLAAQEVLILDGFAWFKDLVAQRRTLSGPALDQVTDGRVFSGQMAVEHGLVDTLGDTQSARDWMAEDHEIDADLPTLTHRWGKQSVPWPLNHFEDATAFLSQTQGHIHATPRLYAIMR